MADRAGGTGGTERRLERRPDERLIGGVAAGLARAFGLEPIVARLVFLATLLLGGGGLLAYVILWVVLPTPDKRAASPGDVARANVEEVVGEGRRVFEGVRDALRSPRDGE
ncbi:PspC domain-containing protein [Egibacter rhizosphaerae]|uniref:PspC domain-containing protein n=1 Tax=Egibacter rhizosphaerae TaxID=1670831 RepID=A0A411YI29_9ACTN|nr:PspC domain-containing protein [Egibacter rhizosphaerae]QBI20918.1 PspC domain-containing protein [Egibacter rhizosphaerae]